MSTIDDNNRKAVMMSTPDIHIVYFSSATGNTKAFVDKLGVPSTAIPVIGESPVMEVPYVLITPTYGGGASLMGRRARSVPVQVSNFLKLNENVALLRAVMSGGNMNFGSDYGRAGELISAKFGVPYVWRFELRGTEYDVDTVLNGLSKMFGVVD